MHFGLICTTTLSGLHKAVVQHFLDPDPVFNSRRWRPQMLLWALAYTSYFHPINICRDRGHKRSDADLIVKLNFKINIQFIYFQGHIILSPTSECMTNNYSKTKKKKKSKMKPLKWKIMFLCTNNLSYTHTHTLRTLFIWMHCQTLGFRKKILHY